MTDNPINILGYACGLGANAPGCCMGPLIFQNSPFFTLDSAHTWVDNLYPKDNATDLDAISCIAECNSRLALYCKQLTHSKTPFLVIGGDHTACIGAWSGASNALSASIGLLNLTPYSPNISSPSLIAGEDNLLQILLGTQTHVLGEIGRLQPKLNALYVCQVGSLIANHSPALKSTDYTLFTNAEIRIQGIANLMQKSIEIVEKSPTGFGVNIDLSACCQPNSVNIPIAEFIKSIHGIGHNTKCLGVAITGFDPNTDDKQTCEKVLGQIVSAIWAK